MTENYKDYQEGQGDVQCFCKFTFGQFFTILVLEIVTLAFVFYLGAKYGTNYLKIAEEEKPSVTEIVAGTPASATNSKELQDTEIQAMARDVMNAGSEENLKARVKELLEKEKQKDQPSAQLPAPAPEAGQAVAAVDNANQPPAEAETTPPAVAPSAPIQMKSSSTGQYSIQVGSYPNMDEASGRVSGWREKGYPAFMMIADIPDRGRWYRVRIGSFATKDDAQGYLEKFRSQEDAEAIIVLNEQ